MQTRRNQQTNHYPKLKQWSTIIIVIGRDFKWWLILVTHLYLLSYLINCSSCHFFVIFTNKIQTSWETIGKWKYQTKCENVNEMCTLTPAAAGGGVGRAPTASHSQIPLLRRLTTAKIQKESPFYQRRASPPTAPLEVTTRSEIYVT